MISAAGSSPGGDVIGVLRPRSGVYEATAGICRGRRVGSVKGGRERQPGLDLAARYRQHVPVGVGAIPGGAGGETIPAKRRLLGRVPRLAVVTCAADRVSVGEMKKSLDRAVRPLPRFQHASTNK